MKCFLHLHHVCMQFNEFAHSLNTSRFFFSFVGSCVLLLLALLNHFTYGRRSRKKWICSCFIILFSPSHLRPHKFIHRFFFSSMDFKKCNFFGGIEIFLLRIFWLNVWDKYLCISWRKCRGWIFKHYTDILAKYVT